MFIYWQKRFIPTFSVFLSWFTHLLINNLHRLLSVWLYLNRFLLNFIDIDRLWTLFCILRSIHRRLDSSLALGFFNFFSYLNLCSLVIRIRHSTTLYSSEISWSLGLGRARLETWPSTAQNWWNHIGAHLVCELGCLHEGVLVGCHVQLVVISRIYRCIVYNFF